MMVFTLCILCVSMYMGGQSTERETYRDTDTEGDTERDMKGGRDGSRERETHTHTHFNWSQIMLFPFKIIETFLS